MYRSAFKLLSTQTREARVVYSMAARTISAGTGPLCRYRICKLVSPVSLQTCIRPSEYSTQNPNLTEKTTLRYSCIQLYRSAHQSRRLSLCCIVKGNQSNGRLADSPRCGKCRRTVRLDPLRAANVSIF
ncbi:hypothetical protein TNCV_3387981 [Trichonephila clavipes]|nr:hypothetical protein TNCV_3387981 [Trichonephila clavipes]